MSGGFQVEVPRAAADIVAAAPPAEQVLAPVDIEQAMAVLERATDERTRVLVWGGGTHQGMGGRVHPDLVLSTAGLDRVIAWEPEDLTVVVEAGMRVSDLEQMLAERGQTAALIEVSGGATVGGVVAAGVSGYRRARYGPTRDRVLEVTLVTGDGRPVRAGGRVVKNVTGYDLPRLATGSFGRMGLIVSVCLKLWPLPEAAFTIPVEDPEAAWAELYRPVAVLETHDGSFAYVAGTRAEAEAQAGQVGDWREEGLRWPAPPGGDLVVSVRVPPASTGAAVRHLPDGSRFVAQHGVGEVTVAMPEGSEAEALGDLRAWAAAQGGALVVLDAPEQFYESFDPWGDPPPGMAIQRRLSAQFDPYAVLNRGRLPGGL